MSQTRKTIIDRINRIHRINSKQKNIIDRINRIDRIHGINSKTEKHNRQDLQD
jgi:hypothetical protein